MSHRSWFVLALGLGLATAACTADTTAPEEELVDSDEAEYHQGDAKAASTYFIIRPDFRRCMSPMCGGYFVKRVNASKTRCVDGSWQESCYVATLDSSAVGVASIRDLDVNRLVLRGSIVADSTIPGPQIKGAWGRFDATEAWEGHGKGATHNDLWSGRWWSNGIFHRYALNGVRCFRAPCPSINGARLNSGWVTGITHFDGTMAIGAMNAMGTGTILGSAWTRYSRDGGRAADLTQFYTKVEATLDPLYCEQDADCTRNSVNELVTDPADCTCAMCPSYPMNSTTAKKYNDAHAQHCSEKQKTCPIPMCAQPPEVGCVNNKCQDVWAPPPPKTCRIPTVTKAHPMHDRFEAPSFKNDCMVDADCMKGGCSGEVCAAEGVVTTCEVIAQTPSGSCGCLGGKCQWNETTFCGSP